MMRIPKRKKIKIKSPPSCNVDSSQKNIIDFYYIKFFVPT